MPKISVSCLLSWDESFVSDTDRNLSIDHKCGYEREGEPFLEVL